MMDVETDPQDIPMKPPRAEMVPQVSYVELKSSATKKAQKTITALMKFYLDADIIERDEYIKRSFLNQKSLFTNTITLVLKVGSLYMHCFLFLL